MAGVNERFGFSVSGDGDLNGDGLSDILVGTSQGGKAYMFFGSQNFGVTAPSVTFSGATAGFGSSVAQIGDIDNDGLPDIAISDASASGEKVYIYKGRTTWPMTLTNVQAEYVISTDATYANSFFGFSVARLGDFTGDGVDDFAIGVRGYNTSVGRVVIIPGKTGFASVSLPDTTNSIVIDCDSTLGSSFLGYKVLGIGHFYSVSSGTTLIASAPSGAASTPPNAGHVYAFHGQTGTGGVISIASADAVIPGMAANAKVGIALADLGTMLNGFPGVGIGNSQDMTDVPGASGTGYLTFGTSATGPFASTRVTYLTGVPSAGAIMIGGGLRGRDVGLSLIGDATPDLVFGGQGGSILTISDGAKIGAKSSPLELVSTSEVLVPLPAGWGGNGEAAGTLVPDINGDGAADFCVGSLANPGAILVFW
jgi:glycosylphosphatidylinositol phospholipase D